ncbi:hypothetical protein Bbelb_192240 [Branchiostoma belcheri]|nr:hypothetical protein Bbelb_192240 [Branchiostoma belcheri]
MTTCERFELRKPVYRLTLVANSRAPKRLHPLSVTPPSPRSQTTVGFLVPLRCWEYCPPAGLVHYRTPGIIISLSRGSRLDSLGTVSSLSPPGQPTHPGDFYLPDFKEGLSGGYGETSSWGMLALVLKG